MYKYYMGDDSQEYVEGENNPVIPEFDYVNAYYDPDYRDPNGNNLGPHMGTTSGDIQRNIDGIQRYARSLMFADDKSEYRVQKTTGILGNQLFVPSGALCEKDENGYSIQDERFIFISNRPDPNPIVDGDEPGLITGIYSNIQRINPANFIDAVFNGKSGQCQKVKLKTFEQDPDDGTTTEASDNQYIAVEDVCKLKKHHFAHYSDYNSLNGLRNIHCDGFSNMKNNIKYSYNEENNCNMPDNELIQLYLTTITLLGLYITLKIIYKK